MNTLGYNIAELPVTDIGHTLKVVRISRAVDTHLQEYRMQTKMYNIKYQTRKTKMQ